MRYVYWLAILLQPLLAVGQTLHLVPVHLEDTTPRLGALKFFCSINYKPSECTKDVRTLQRSLLQYPVEQLGRWSFLLETTDECSDLIRRLGGPSESPALTILTRNLTLLDRALFSTTVDRSAQLIRAFNARGDDLLELAISHELGHAICADLNETHAQEYGQKLREGQRIDCLTNPHRTSHRQAFAR